VETVLLGVLASQIACYADLSADAARPAGKRGRR
jgi:hypothetical protein